MENEKEERQGGKERQKSESSGFFDIFLVTEKLKIVPPKARNFVFFGAFPIERGPYRASEL